MEERIKFNGVEKVHFALSGVNVKIKPSAFLDTELCTVKRK